MTNKKISGQIQTYSRKARDAVTKMAERFLADYGISGISMNLFTCVDELIKNAVKANYKFILIHDEIFSRMNESYKNFSPNDIEVEIKDLLKIQESFDHMAGDILSEKNLSYDVRQILNEESRVLNIKNRAYKEGRNLTDSERNEIASYEGICAMKSRGKDLGVKIILKIQANTDYFYIEVTNTAPILTSDLNRIYAKRDEYRKYRDQGKECEFFVNNLDTSESGFGLGYATIDSILYNWGLDPERALTIISSIDTTILLSLPIDELKKESQGEKK